MLKMSEGIASGADQNDASASAGQRRVARDGLTLAGSGAPKSRLTLTGCRGGRSSTESRSSGVGVI